MRVGTSFESRVHVSDFVLDYGNKFFNTGTKFPEIFVTPEQNSWERNSGDSPTPNSPRIATAIILRVCDHSCDINKLLIFACMENL